MRRALFAMSAVAAVVLAAAPAAHAASAAPRNAPWSGYQYLRDNSGAGDWIGPSGGLEYTWNSDVNADQFRVYNGDEIQAASDGECWAWSATNAHFYLTDNCGLAAAKFTFKVNGGGSFTIRNTYAGACVKGFGNGVLLQTGACTGGGAGTIWNIG